MLRKMENSGLEMRLNIEVLQIEKTKENFRVLIQNTNNTNDQSWITGKQVFNCTYAGINSINKRGNIPDISLKFELAELCLVEPPEELRDKGITMMCGPFFSTMPFPARGLHSLTHVRYTPHVEWYSNNENGKSVADILRSQKHKTAYPKMLADSSRFLPIMKKCKYKDSLWEIKTLLPRSERDDSRPILFKLNHGVEGYHCVMGGKIDNIYDAIEIIKKGLL